LTKIAKPLIHQVFDVAGQRSYMPLLERKIASSQVQGTEDRNQLILARRRVVICSMLDINTDMYHEVMPQFKE
jgi:hypothetical protein